MVDEFGTPKAFEANVALEYQRNIERYQFLKWGADAFDNFQVVPPGTGICHQVNLEYIARGVWSTPEVGAAPTAAPPRPPRRPPGRADRRERADADGCRRRREPTRPTGAPPIAAPRPAAERAARADEIAYPGHSRRHRQPHHDGQRPLVFASSRIYRLRGNHDLAPYNPPSIRFCRVASSVHGRKCGSGSHPKSPHRDTELRLRDKSTCMRMPQLLIESQQILRQIVLANNLSLLLYRPILAIIVQNRCDIRFDRVPAESFANITLVSITPSVCCQRRSGICSFTAAISSSRFI